MVSILRLRENENVSYDLALLMGAQAEPGQPAHLPARLHIAGGEIPQIGSFIPSSQLLKWCTGTEPADRSLYSGYISGVLNAAGMADASFPKGPIYNPSIGFDGDIQKAVTDYLKSLPNVKMTNPASRSVYAALVEKYPYSGIFHPTYLFDHRRMARHHQ